jgi:hypothetical protein
MNKHDLKRTACPECGKHDMTVFIPYVNACTCAECGFELVGCFTDEEMQQNNLIDEIKETIYMIEKDLDPYDRGDSMNYSGYMMENALDLKNLVFKLLKGE